MSVIFNDADAFDALEPMYREVAVVFIPASVKTVVAPAGQYSIVLVAVTRYPLPVNAARLPILSEST